MELHGSLAKAWPSLAKLGQSLPKLGQGLAKYGQGLAKLGKAWPRRGQAGQRLASLGQAWHSLAKAYHSLAKAWPSLANFGQGLRKLGRCLGKAWPGLGKWRHGILWASCHTASANLWSGSSRRSAGGRNVAAPFVTCVPTLCHSFLLARSVSARALLIQKISNQLILITPHMTYPPNPCHPSWTVLEASWRPLGRS